MNCVVVCNAFGDWISGANTVVNIYAKELQRRGWRITVLSRTRTEKKGWMVVDGLNVFYVSTNVKRRRWSNIPYQAWSYYRKVHDTVEAVKDLKLGPDVVWVHYGTPDALWVANNVFPDVRKVFHIHGVWTKDFLEQFKKEFKLKFLGVLASLPLVYMEKWFLKKGDAIIVYSHWVKKLLEKRVRNKPIHVICNPLNTEVFNRNVMAFPRQKLGFKKGDTVIIYVGKFTPLKGTETFLDAANQLPSFKFLLVGQPIAMPKGYYRKHAGSNVFFHEPISHDDVACYMKMADCVVQPTVRDGLELPIAEGLAVGVPVVTTSHEERREIYEDVVTYAEPYSSVSLAEAIKWAVQVRMPHATQVLDKFNVRKNVDKIEAILKGDKPC